MSHFGRGMERALEEIGLPAYTLNRQGRITWMNRQAKALFGDRVGRPYTDAVSPDTVPTARIALAKKMLGTEPATRESGFLLAANGERVPVEIYGATIRDDTNIVGVFGIISVKNTRRLSAAPAGLTPRQTQVLHLLADGSSTDQIGAALCIQTETVRNHIRASLSTFRVHSRLEAVIEAYRRGLIVEPAGVVNT
jgi:DNA-binding CsgD family transcriptional regulator